MTVLRFNRSVNPRADGAASPRSVSRREPGRNIFARVLGAPRFSGAPSWTIYVDISLFDFVYCSYIFVVIYSKIFYDKMSFRVHGEGVRRRDKSLTRINRKKDRDAKAAKASQRISN